MKAWLCLNPVKLVATTSEGKDVDVRLPPNAVALLPIYPTKKAGREVHGRKAQFVKVDVCRFEGKERAYL